MSTKIKDIDRGWSDIKKTLRKSDGSFTKVGVQQGTKHKGEDGISDLVIIAAVNEFGTFRIPSRPALRQAIDGNEAKINSFTAELYGKMLDGKISERRALGLLGEYVTNLMKESITRLSEPPNAQSTKDKKGSSNPLIDTGQYRNSITHVEVIK